MNIIKKLMKPLALRFWRSERDWWSVEATALLNGSSADDYFFALDQLHQINVTIARWEAV